MPDGGVMEIRERIANCLSTLGERRQLILAFEEKVKAVIAALKAKGGAPVAIGEMVGVLEEVLRSYGEISLSCSQMIEGLTEVGQHVDRIEEGRRKIITGVEAILGKLSQLESLAAQGFQVGVSAPAAEAEQRPRRILLIRIRPDQEKLDEVPAQQELAEEEGDDQGLPSSARETIH